MKTHSFQIFHRKIKKKSQREKGFIGEIEREGMGRKGLGEREPKSDGLRLPWHFNDWPCKTIVLVLLVYCKRTVKTFLHKILIKYNTVHRYSIVTLFNSNSFTIRSNGLAKPLQYNSCNSC